MNERDRMRRDVGIIQRYMRAVESFETLGLPIPPTLSISADRALRRIRKLFDEGRQ